MPGKRTNDSVDKILEELNRQQLDQGLRTSLNDQQVDDILRSVGIPVDNPGTAHTPPSPDVDALLADLIPGAAPGGHRHGGRHHQHRHHQEFSAENGP